MVPKIIWINEVPDCGKTTWVVKYFELGRNVVITTTREAARYLKEKLVNRLGADACSKVRTMASILVNDFQGSKSCNQLNVDEALMSHFGSIVMVTRLVDAKEVLLIDDANQLPFIDRLNLFEIQYIRPSLVATVTKELLSTYRKSMDVAYVLNEVYSGIYSSITRVRSLRMERYSDTNIPKYLRNTLYLTYTQVEKESLITQGFGKGKETHVLTIHEAQGLTTEGTVIVRITTIHKIHDSVSHAVVAITRHTVSYVYHTDDSKNAIGRFIKRAVTASENKIKNNNAKMTIRNKS
ncbi:hypothetical protein EVAR_44165_1 [Eumeta japonica]|uniref:(+)RNA virus helicase C-terminal domain-containing protein n=1 Tax=Eumeta variegata TaxID=151549 RepID=A0A4C1W3F1_EUMVA|nr:hypothetical protein EVAR_44165_1 [Eumeta japonica]